MTIIKFILGIALSMVTILSCASNHEELDVKQQAQKSLNEGDAQKAIELLAPYTADNDQDYEALCLLASAFATRAGLDILSLIQSQMDQSSSETSNDVFARVESFLPSGANQDTLSDIDSAIDQLQRIPADLYTTDEKYAQSAIIQLVLYYPIRATMLLLLMRQGIFDVEQGLASILQSLQNTRLLPFESNSMQSAVARTLSRIYSQEGDSESEQLANYLGIERLEVVSNF